MINPRSKKLYGEALKFLPGGVNSPVRAFNSVKGHPLFIKKGKGAYLYDEDHHKYIDFCLSWGPLILGHSDSDVVKAIKTTASLGTSFGTNHQSEVKLAKLITSSFPSIEKVRFVNSGTEATMSAIRLARGYTGRDKIIKFEGCYHGHADFLLVAAGSGLASLGIPDSAGVTKKNAQETIVLPYNDLNALEKCLKKEGPKIAALIIEPVPCNCGLILPKPNYLKKIRQLCDQYKIVLIFDEVITGFRLARGGAQEIFKIKADLTTLGKIIGGGLPVGAYGGQEKIMKHIAPEGPVYQAGTLSGNPLAMQAGMATLSKLKNKTFYKDLKTKMDFFIKILKPILKTYQGKIIFEHLGSIFFLTFSSEKTLSSPGQIKKSNHQLFAKFHAEMLKQGVYLAPSGYEVGFLSNAHTKADLKKTVLAIEKSLQKILNKVK